VQLKCFHSTNESFFRAQRARILKLSQKERKYLLHQMLRTVILKGREKKFFFFDGRPVCAKFMRKGFGFCSDLQCSVKGTRKARGTKSIERMPRSGAVMHVRDHIRLFIQNLAESTSNRMPDTDEFHLPYFQRSHVYEVLEKAWSLVDECGNHLPPPSFHYFMDVWNKYHKKVKCAKVHRFSKCDICEKLRQELSEAGLDRTLSDKLREMKRVHNEFVASERLEYYRKRSRARDFPDRFCSIVVDGADQAAYALPHWPLSTKQPNMDPS